MILKSTIIHLINHSSVSIYIVLLSKIGNKLSICQFNNKRKFRFRKRMTLSVCDRLSSVEELKILGKTRVRGQINLIFLIKRLITFY